jgi:indolepyruvate ferredoxin oxidoreductase
VETTPYELAARYRADRTTTFLSGTQALARLPIEQMVVDRRAGLRTAAFISGYPGSPLGGFDGAVTEAIRHRPELEIHHQPGLNEEYAATAVMGSQVANAQHDARYDGVLGIWYGKAPGVDRAVDALRHGGYAGTSPHGGVVALVGDDPVAKSSSVPSSSAGVLADLHMPLLYPGDPAEALELGRHAIALSRATGLWAALKIVADVADGTASVGLDVDRIQPVVPLLNGVPYDRIPDGRLLTPHTIDIEREIYEVRYPLAIEYARLNRLNHVTVGRSDAWIGILSSGITYREVREALGRMGLADDDAIADAGIRLFRMQMPIPFNAASVREFAAGLDEIVVVEEKQPNLESLIKDALYGLAERPRIVGKLDEHDRPFLRGYGGLDADTLVPHLRSRLEHRIGSRLAPPPPSPRELIPVAVQRTPFYCSGCPHNRSTEVPDGSLVGAGIGCHTMTMLMDPTRVGDISGLTPMGNEGTQWIGMSPFIERDHFIQNLGDGTFFHSGQLAITAAIAANVNVTYKLLYNGAIAMTGGQDPQGALGVPAIARNLLNQGASKVLVTTDDVAKYRRVSLPKSVEVWYRDRIVEAQEHLATVPGVTVLIHDQACAAEARRLRKRGLIKTPTQRIVINQRICEGCGDCGEVSNCLSVQPVETPFGRKTHIDQTTCNLDYSCTEGDCPSFMVIETEPSLLGRIGARLFDRRRHDGPELDAKGAAQSSGMSVAADDLPEPVLVVPTSEMALRITGIGGTGVVTVAQILGTAGMLDGFEVRGLDQIGLSQKAGPVVSDLRFGIESSAHTNRLGSGQADLLLALDQLVASSDKGLSAVTDRTVVVGSTSVTPTGAMITRPDLAAPAAPELAERIADVTRSDQQHWADALAITTAHLGSGVTANIFVVGMAYQAGALPMSADRIEEAIGLNGAAVDANLSAFRLGRRFVVDPTFADGDLSERPVDAELLGDVAALVPDHAAELSMLAADLVGYQNQRYARSFVDVVRHVAEREAVAAPDAVGRELTITVARGLHKVMAYKDEYEVARLMFDTGGRSEAEQLAGTGSVIAVKLHPPALRALGLRSKLSFGPFWSPVFALLRRGKVLRHTPFDLFGYATVRREERRLVREYRSLIEDLVVHLRADNYDDSVATAGLIDMVRGYEDIKMRRIAEYRSLLSTRPAVAPR